MFALRRLARGAACALALRVPAARVLLPTRARLVCEWHRGPAQADTLVVMLPGIGDYPRDFAAHGLVPTLRGARDADVVAVDTHFGYYARRTLIERLHHDVVEPARRAGYRRVWLVGISLGGLGALLYAPQYPRAVDGLVLLAPFVGHAPIIREIEAAGGVARWHPPSLHEADFERRLWLWLKSYRPEDGPQIWLGYGVQDPFARGNRLLSSRLPASQVVTAFGGHRWRVWRSVWATLLERGVLQP